MATLVIADLLPNDQTTENTSVSVSEEVSTIVVEDLEDDG